MRSPRSRSDLSEVISPNIWTSPPWINGLADISRCPPSMSRWRMYCGAWLVFFRKYKRSCKLLACVGKSKVTLKNRTERACLKKGLHTSENAERDGSSSCNWSMIIQTTSGGRTERITCPSFMAHMPFTVIARVSSESLSIAAKNHEEVG